MRRSFVCSVLGLALVAGPACDKNKGSTDPESGSNLVGGLDAEDESLGEEDAFGEEASAEEAWTPEPFPAIAKPSKPVERCTGKGKKRSCKTVDPKPEISAAWGAREMLGEFRWGMTPGQVFKVLSKDIEAEYERRQKESSEAMAQDTNRQWRQEQLQSLKANHVKFVKAGGHRWGVSLIQFEYEDDANEELVWINANPTLKKYYFFKDNELWKILYAYSSEAWQGKSYAEVVDERFKKWFGPSPEEKVKQDPKSGEILLRYNEWKSVDGDRVRSFDMTAVHGVIALVVVGGSAEDRIGERLPNIKKEEGYSDTVNEVLGSSDVCYDKAGEIVECAEGGKIK
jgi:hypothetical protein